MRDPIIVLAELIDAQPEDIATSQSTLRSGEAYERFEIPKLGGRGPRIITAPIAVLKAVQRRLNVVLEGLPLSSAVHGFRRGRSIVTAAKKHIGSQALINVDLADFFHSVDDERVIRTLQRSLRPRLVEETGELSRTEADAVIDLIAELTTCRIERRPRPVLPQGAPTSPILSNLAARPLDAEIRELLESTPGEFVYTRYADDLSISSPHEIHRELLGAILRTIQRMGFAPNQGKIRIASTLRGSPHYRQKLEVTGLIIDTRERCVRIPRARMERFRLDLHQAALVPDLDERTLYRIEGIVSFAHMVYGNLPASLDAAYARFCEQHKRPRLAPGKSRERARKAALNDQLYR